MLCVLTLVIGRIMSGMCLDTGYRLFVIPMIIKIDNIQK